MFILNNKHCRLNLLLLFIFICLSITFNSTVSAGLKKKIVESSGSGATLNAAIYDALDEAIGRVNGKSLETRQQLDSVEISTADNQKEDYFSSEVFQSSINSATKGVVDSYEILTKNENNELGLYEVNLSVTVLKFVVQDSNRKRIAVIPFQAGDGGFLITGESVSKERATRILTQNLVTTLVQTRRFTVLDREYMKETLGEKDLSLSPNTPVAEMAKLGQELVADYIMVGVLESINVSEKTRRMKSSGREFSYMQGGIELSVRLIDVATRQIAFSEFMKLKLTENDLKRYDYSFSDEGPEASVAVVAANKIGHKIIDVIYPIVIVSVNGENVVLGQGGSQLKSGDRLEIFKLGERLTDPYTKEYLGREEIQVGLIRVTRVNPKQSYANIIKSTVDITTEFEPKKFICRFPQDASAQKEAEREERHKKRNDRRKKHDSDW